MLKISHHCHNCGYNLTANTTGVCPECGAATARGLP
jgi:rubrerythrin